MIAPSHCIECNELVTGRCAWSGCPFAQGLNDVGCEHTHALAPSPSLSFHTTVDTPGRQAKHG